MNEYNVSDYGIFSNAISTIQNTNTKIETGKTQISEAKTKLSSESIFMGPAADETKNGCAQVESKLSTMTTNFNTLSDHLKTSSNNYQAGDQAASTTVEQVGSETSQAALTASKGTPKSTCEIPDNLAQAGYTVTCYGVSGWHLSGKEQATPIAKGTNQEKVHDKWVADGGRYKSGIAVMNVNGQDHYLVATTEALGKVGQVVDVRLKNGQTIPCVIADAKSKNDSNYTTYGHGRKDGSVNVLEFEVDRLQFLKSSNPTTEKWGLEWDSSSGVKSVDNYGYII